VAVTLLRAVGYLGAGFELQTASIGGGPNIATPEAQIQRKISYSLALLPHRGYWDEVEVWRNAQDFNNPPRAYTTGMVKNRSAVVGSPAPSCRSMFSIEGGNVVLSALKKTNEGEALIVRLYNPSGLPTQAFIQLSFIPSSVVLTRLDEQSLLSDFESNPPTIEAGERVRITLPPKKIITLRIERN
jgi:alpha-mannosidase